MLTPFNCRQLFPLAHLHDDSKQVILLAFRSAMQPTLPISAALPVPRKRLTTTGAKLGWKRNLLFSLAHILENHAHNPTVTI